MAGKANGEEKRAADLDGGKEEGKRRWCDTSLSTYCVLGVVLSMSPRDGGYCTHCQLKKLSLQEAVRDAHGH